MLHQPGSILFFIRASISHNHHLLGKRKRSQRLNARRYGQTTSCTTCARSDSDGASRLDL